jgi:hypothetical protein
MCLLLKAAVGFGLSWVHQGRHLAQAASHRMASQAAAWLAARAAACLWLWLVLVLGLVQVPLLWQMPVVQAVVGWSLGRQGHHLAQAA